MVHVPRSSISSFPAPSPTNGITNGKDYHENQKQQQQQHHQPINFSYESVYSNEYEPIGGGSSDHNSSSSHYVDLEMKSDNESTQHKSHAQKHKHPPALPPKPANLMKLRQALRMTSGGKIPSSSSSPTKSPPSANNSNFPDNESEPDYCSISEVSETIKKFEIVADVHKNADAMSTASEDTRTEMTDETFADIPKLPNVAAILSPKKDLSKFIIAQDNYITKSPVGIKSSSSCSSSSNNNDEHNIKQIPFIFAELANKKILAPAPIRLASVGSNSSTKMASIVESRPVQQTPAPSAPPQPPVIALPKMPDVEKMQMHAEFDWYNLDVEYGKLSGIDVMKMSNTMQSNVNRVDEEIDENAENIIGVEYNLDQEFDDSVNNVNHSDNDGGDDNCNDPIGNIMDIELMETQAVNGGGGGRLRYNQIGDCAETPKKKTFESFLSDTGLTTKPLPRKRKIYYSAPFV